MPSPFPGMDPFLEHPNVFPDLHDRLVTYLSEFLQAQLPQPYYAAIGRRAWIEVSERFIGPDVEVLKPSIERACATQSADLAVATDVSAEPVVVHVPHDERHEPLIEVYVPHGSGRRLVTTIEVLSLSNKVAGEHGRDLYLRKQKEILDRKVHLVEIDLLRAGEHTTAVPRDRLAAAIGRFDYHVCIHRFDNLEDYSVYPVQLTQRLPVIAIPLLSADSPVPIDLQALFDRCYDTGPYRREIHYRQDTLVPPLSEDAAAWAQTRLAQIDA